MLGKSAQLEKIRAAVAIAFYDNPPSWKHPNGISNQGQAEWSLDPVPPNLGFHSKWLHQNSE
ncbi:hypothetical protein NON20_00675 [Synechocystis sp. B12]|nr:hypothetical protein NON20_00675 [Synechocystis sp. B12]